MPKARLSPEEKIIEYFKTAPRDIAGVVLKLATNELRRRSPTPVPARPKTSVAKGAQAEEKGA